MTYRPHRPPSRPSRWPATAPRFSRSRAARARSFVHDDAVPRRQERRTSTSPRAASACRAPRFDDTVAIILGDDAKPSRVEPLDPEAPIGIGDRRTLARPVADGDHSHRRMRHGVTRRVEDSAPHAALRRRRERPRCCNVRFPAKRFGGRPRSGPRSERQDGHDRREHRSCRGDADVRCPEALALSRISRERPCRHGERAHIPRALRRCLHHRDLGPFRIARATPCSSLAFRTSRLRLGSTNRVHAPNARRRRRDSSSILSEASDGLAEATSRTRDKAA